MTVDINPFLAAFILAAVIYLVIRPTAGHKDSDHE